MVHQHFMLVPVFTVAENVMLGVEPTRALGLLDRRQARRQVRELSERYGLQVNPDALIEDLPVGVQQRVEIIKALMRQASVLILDEPTAVLTPGETEDLFRIMRELRSGGRSIVFISHKLKEVQAIADQITVIRRGRVVGERPPTATDAELAALMVGRPVELRVSKEPARPKDVVLDVSELTVTGELIPDEKDTAANALDAISFQVRAGEILGIAGVQGNGQTELCEALMGLRPATGTVRLDGRDITRASPRDRLRAGMAYIPEDRQQDGIVKDFSVADNLVLDTYDRPPYAKGIAMDLPAIREHAKEPGRRVRRADLLDRHHGRHAVRRQPAEGDPGPGGGPPGPAAAGQPAHPRPGRRVDRVRAPPDRRGTRPGRRGDHRLVRAGRDLRAGRPDRRHVRGEDHRVPAADRAGSRARPADGGGHDRGRGRRTAWPGPAWRPAARPSRRPTRRSAWCR